MKINSSAIISQNITIVYQAIDLASIDTRQLRSLVKDIKPAIIDMPDMLVAAYPPLPLIIQFGDSRIRVTWQQETTELAALIWETALSCHRLVTQHPVIAYGFNYGVGVTVDDASGSIGVLSVFDFDRTALESALDGQLEFLPRLQFQREGIHYDFIIERLDSQRMKILLNAHFAGSELPPVNALEASFRSQYDYGLSLLHRILEGRDQ